MTYRYRWVTAANCDDTTSHHGEKLDHVAAERHQPAERRQLPHRHPVGRPRRLPRQPADPDDPAAPLPQDVEDRRGPTAHDSCHRCCCTSRAGSSACVPIVNYRIARARSPGTRGRRPCGRALDRAPRLGGSGALVTDEPSARQSKRLDGASRKARVAEPLPVRDHRTGDRRRRVGHAENFDVESLVASGGFAGAVAHHVSPLPMRSRTAIWPGGTGEPVQSIAVAAHQQVAGLDPTLVIGPSFDLRSTYL